MTEKNDFLNRIVRLQDDIRLLEEDIKIYINNKNDESLSYLSYFDKRFPILMNNVVGIYKGVDALIEGAE